MSGIIHSCSHPNDERKRSESPMMCIQRHISLVLRPDILVSVPDPTYAILLVNGEEWGGGGGGGGIAV